jgi:hypothetical protein
VTTVVLFVVWPNRDVLPPKVPRDFVEAAFAARLHPADRIDDVVEIIECLIIEPTELNAWS